MRAEQEQDLEFSIRWEANLDDWLERGTALFDQRTAIPYGTMEGLADKARGILVPAWTSGRPGTRPTGDGGVPYRFRGSGTFAEQVYA